jgi:hypothetical protein
MTQSTANPSQLLNSLLTDSGWLWSKPADKTHDISGACRKIPYRERRLTARDPIKLRDAPARFLNTAWLRLMDLKGSDAKAVETLSHPDPGMLAYYRRQVIAAGRGGQEALAQEDISALAETMITSFRELGASGQIIGHGIYSWAGLRQPIPLELWPDLRFDFEANKASDDEFSYSHVTIDQDGPAWFPRGYRRQDRRAADAASAGEWQSTQENASGRRACRIRQRLYREGVQRSL